MRAPGATNNCCLGVSDTLATTSHRSVMVVGCAGDLCELTRAPKGSTVVIR